MTVSTNELFELLKASDDFKELSSEVVLELAKSMRLHNISGGSTFIREGEDANSLFLLVSGRLRVNRIDEQGNKLMYNEVLPGDCIGETSMILRQKRTADISATRDSIVAILTYDHYEELVKRFPVELNKAFSSAIYRELRHERFAGQRRRAQSFYLLPIHNSADIHRFAKNLKVALSAEGVCETLSTEDLPGSDITSYELAKVLDEKEISTDYLIIVGDGSLSDIQRSLFEHADQLILVADGLSSVGLTDVEKTIAQHPNFPLIRRHVALVYQQEAHFCGDRLVWNEPRDAERVYPVTLNEIKDYERLGRFLLEKAVGLVLGGGGARGFAHLGILRAFEENNIPVDLIGGNSMGALIGASYVAGIPRETIHQEIMKHSKGGMKLTVPVVSLMSNANLAGAFRDALGDVNIQNLWTPFFAAACNLSDADTTVIDSGPLWRAVLASNSPAGLFPPVVVDGNLLVDGAILENVPVAAMRQKLSTPLERRRGNGLVIAIDVDLKDRFGVDTELEEISPWQKVKSHFTKEKDTLPGIVDILMQVAHVGGLSQRNFTKRSADIYLEVPLSQFKMMDYKKAEQIIEAGYQFAMKEIDKLKDQVRS